MSGWTAINVEPEDDTTIEIDDTKEIQLEEAFKLYQNALRLHSQGPASYQAARDAYDELFKSDVFKYPEAASEFDQDQQDESSPTLVLSAETAIVPIAAGGTSDNANSIPLLLYLAYKSRAQFEIDTIRMVLDVVPARKPSELFKHYGSACKQSLIHSAAALERDDTDLDLWKRASRVSDLLQTIRIVRFCLESVLAGDEEGEDAIDLSGLDEAYAKGELQSVLHMVADDLAKFRTSELKPKNNLLSLLQQSNDPYPFLPQKPNRIEYTDAFKRPGSLSLNPGEMRFLLASETHLAIGQAFLQSSTAKLDSSRDLPIGGWVKFILPHLQHASDIDMTTDNPDHEVSVKSAIEIDDPLLAASVEAESPASFHSVPDRIQSMEPSPKELSVDLGLNAPALEDSPKPETRNTTVVPASTSTETVILPSRKRSSTTAGIDEPEARTKSKRIKARESLAGIVAQEEEISQDPFSIYRDQFTAIEIADDMTFKSVNSILDRIGIDNLGSIELVREKHYDEHEEQQQDSATDTDPIRQNISDLKHALKNWNEERSGAFMSGHVGRDHVEKTTGLTLFLKHSRSAIAKEATVPMVDDETQVRLFVETLNGQAINLQQALFLWLLQLLTGCSGNDRTSVYLQGVWSADLKQVVVQLITSNHEDIMTFFRKVTSSPFQVEDVKLSQVSKSSLKMDQAAEFAQTMFELHLDIYSEMTSPMSTVDDLTKRQQLQRLQTWAQAATDTIQFLPVKTQLSEGQIEQLVLRFLWASVGFAKVSASVDKSHILLCLDDLQCVLEGASTKEILLPNNTVMPRISSIAVEQEISRVKTLEFFMSVFDSDSSDPLPVIMKLEPILEYDKESALLSGDREQVENFRAFLLAGDASLTLFLWKRLQNAYTAVSYSTKVVSCLLRSIETITQEILSSHHAELEASDRETSLLKWLRDADELIMKILAKVADDTNAFECIHDSHLASSVTSLVSLIRIIYEFVLVDDSLRVGFTTPPSHRNATASKNFEKCRDRFREMHVRLWTLLYLMIKEATMQMAERFDDAKQDLITYLRCVHASLGERQYCRYCNKLFVRTAKAELFSFDTEEDLSVDIAQIIYDLYQIKLSSGYGDADHGCSAEALEKDKKTAQTLVPIIMDYVKRLNVKDLLRSDLKSTIDRIQNALGSAKPSTALSFNRRAVSAYLKSVVNPRHLYQATRGIGELETKIVHSDTANLASQGWYLLLGNMTLAKYKSVKRVNPTPTDDLDNASAFLRQDIEYDPTNWESWYRLAQVCDAKIEDNLIWNANKLNEGRSELAILERNAINAYTMATALAMRSAEDNIVVTKAIHDMLFEFGLRLYSSSRPPLNMDAFNTDKAVRHLSNYYNQLDMSKQNMFDPMCDYSVWVFSAYLIRRSLNTETKPWLRYYILGKCLWKMFKSSANSKAKCPVDVEEIIDTFSEAVMRVPKKERSSDPILEPHYKFVSTIHKLQDTKTISTDVAVEHLQVTQYARGIQLSEDEQGNPDWEGYILAVLKKLQNADKSGWHHRITARAAHVIYDNDSDIQGALGAKHQFVDTIFTKSMIMQVWKPEHERAGRHYVYTGRYLQFFIEILDKLRDRSNLEQVVRKIRRKTTDFVNHTKVWEDAVTIYIDLLRRLGNIPRGRERALFDVISFDEFTRQSEKLEKWAHDPETTTSYLDIIKDAIEMKKLNNSLMKGSVIDDLIGDAYACMYELFISQLPPEEQAPAPKPELPQGTFFNMTTETAPTGDDNRDRMRLNNVLSGQVDGAVNGDKPSTTGLGIDTSAIQSVSTPPPDSIRVPGPAKPGRAKTITRREVQRKAEGAIGKPPPIKTPTLTKRSIFVNLPSMKKETSEMHNDDGETGSRIDENIASGLSSRRGSFSMRNTPNPDLPDGEDDGGDGDNEEDEEEEDEEEEEEDNDEEGSGIDETLQNRRLFSSLRHANPKEDEDDEDVDHEEGDDSDGDRMSDIKGDQEEDEDGPEIPDSQGMPGQDDHKDAMDTD